MDLNATCTKLIVINVSSGYGVQAMLHLAQLQSLTQNGDGVSSLSSHG